MLQTLKIYIKVAVDLESVLNIFEGETSLKPMQGKGNT